MAENEQTKVCPLCAETIKAAARVCPYCRKTQRRGFFINRFDLLAIVTGLLFSGTMVLIFNMFGSGRSFSPGRDKLEVLNSQLSVESSSVSTNVVMTGILTNRGDHAWKDLGFEVRYLDGSGKIVDVDSGGDYFTVASHGDHSFHVLLGSRRSIPEYAIYQVKVRSATDPGRWFTDEY
jgi:hypothetical protein